MFWRYTLLRPLGLINSKVGLILIYTGTMAEFGLLNMKGYFDTIPREIEEAAEIDGRKRHPACHAHCSSAGAPQYFGYGGYDLDLCLE